MTRRFFVYVHRKADTGEVFYVGKGTQKKGYPHARAYQEKKRNIYWQRVVARHGFRTEVVAEFHEEGLAFAMECDLIAHYGRQVDGGCLCNLTVGGEGGSGRVASEETRRKMSESMRGRVRSAEHCQKLSEVRMGWQPSRAQAEAHAARMAGCGNPNFGRQRSSETKANIAAGRKGKLAGSEHPFFGMKRPEVAAKLRGANGPKARRVIDTASGTEYGCIGDAAKAIGVGLTTLSRWLSGARPNKSQMRYA